jgi:Secretion system C-terminal sorting domain
MKTNYNVIKIVAIALLVSSTSWGQTTLVQWNFNGTSATTVPGGASAPTPILGAGTAALVGGTTATFASGISSGGSSDPVTTSPNNYGWNTTNYAAFGTENKQRGVQFNVSTLGFAGITLTFDQRLSNTSNNTYVVQYTTDRTVASPTWVDVQLFTQPQGLSGTTGGDVWHNLRFVDLIDVVALNNNPNVAFRVVSAFDPTAGDYLSSTGTANTPPYTYLVTGTVRYDMVTVKAASVLGVSQFEANANEFRFYPNPSNKEVVTFNQTQDIEVFDTLGKLVLKAKNTNSIDTKSFHSGIYFIRTGNGLTRKLIVK